MAIEQMELLNLTFPKKELKPILALMQDNEHFAPILANKVMNNVKGVASLKRNEELAKQLERLREIASHINLELNEAKGEDKDLAVSEEILSSVEKEVSQIIKNKEQLAEELEENKAALGLIGALQASHVNIDELKSTKYIVTRVGRIRLKDEHKLSYYHSKQVMYYKLGQTAKHVYCLYTATKHAIVQIDNIFSSMGFKEIELPDFIHGTIDSAKDELQEEIKGMESYIKSADEKLEVIKLRYQDTLSDLYASLYTMNEKEKEKDFIVDYSTVYGLAGFIPKRNGADFKNKLTALNADIRVLPCDMYEDQGVIAPTITYNYFFAKPFEMISKVKEKERVDTTLAYAMMYILTFMLLLGDLGVGAVLLVLGLMMHKKKIGQLLEVLGISTAIGGLLYGNVFYVHNLYPSLIPQGDVVLRFINAVILLFVGSFIINTAKTIYNENRVVDKVFSFNGFVGVMIVLAIMSYILISIDTHIVVSVMPVIVIVALGIITILMKKIMHKK